MSGLMVIVYLTVKFAEDFVEWLWENLVEKISYHVLWPFKFSVALVGWLWSNVVGIAEQLWQGMTTVGQLLRRCYCRPEQIPGSSPPSTPPNRQLDSKSNPPSPDEGSPAANSDNREFSASSPSNTSTPNLQDIANGNLNSNEPKAQGPQSEKSVDARTSPDE